MLCPQDFSNSNIALHKFFALFESIVKYLMEPLQPRTIVAIFWWLIVFAIFFEDNGRCLVLREGNCHCRYFSNVCHPSWLYRRSWVSFQFFDTPYKRKFASELRFCYLHSWLFHSILIMFIIGLLQILIFLYY